MRAYTRCSELIKINGEAVRADKGGVMQRPDCLGVGTEPAPAPAPGVRLMLAKLAPARLVRR